MGMPSRSEQRVRTFCGNRARGNRHSVNVLPSPLLAASDALCARSLGTSEIIVGLSDDRQRAEACFYHRGYPVKRCGSGNLACAAILNRLHDAHEMQLLTPAGKVTLFAENEWYGYQTASDLRYKTGPTWAIDERCFNVPPEQLIFCGDDEDYIILVYENPADLISLTPNHSRICQATRRAIIATAPADRDGYDYLVRYFAPQWGNDEDAATGSANTVLAPYWLDRLKVSEIWGFQASPDGGEFKIETDKHKMDTVIVWGHCSIGL